MRYESRVVTVGWIPSEAIKGLAKLPFEMGAAHYDEPLPDQLGDLGAWAAEDRFRFANDLRGWVEVEDGRIVDHGQAGGIVMGSTTVRVGASVTFQAIAHPDLRPEPEIGDGRVTFRQTVGGRTGVPAPRHVSRPPFVQYHAPTVWTSLALTIHADGAASWKLEGSSDFPRVWVYGPSGSLAAKTGLLDFKRWMRTAFGANSPWGGEDSPSLVADVESALERQLSAVIMKGGRPKIHNLKEGAVLTEQGEEATSIYLLLDGVVTVHVDGAEVAALGPGALIGERAMLEGGRRTATLRAATPVKVAEARRVELDLDALAAISVDHRREERLPS